MGMKEKSLSKYIEKSNLWDLIDLKDPNDFQFFGKR